MGKWFTEEEKYRIVKMRKAGVSAKTIADTIGGRTRESIQNFLSKSGIEFPRAKRADNKYDKEYVAEWERRWTAGESQASIARKEGVSPQFVCQKITKWFYDELV